MSVSGRVNVDAVLHDAVEGSIKVLELESSESVTTKSALITGTATANGTVVDPSSTSYRDAAGDSVVFASVDTVVLKAASELTLTAGTVVLKNNAGECAVSATPGHSTGNITITGSGLFSLLLIGE